MLINALKQFISLYPTHIITLNILFADDIHLVGLQRYCYKIHDYRKHLTILLDILIKMITRIKNDLVVSNIYE